MHAACVITFRASSPERVRNLHHVVHWLAGVPDLETLVVEQDREPALDAADLPASCRLVFARNPGPFNRSWGLNVGFHVVDAEVIAFSDADIIINHHRLRLALEACGRTHEVVRPWSSVVDLTEEETVLLVAGRFDEARVFVPGRFGRRHVGERPPLCGGMYVIRRAVYERLGGQDERFFGWGGEDDAMSLKVAAMCSRIGMLRDTLALHLYHPRHASLPVDDPDYRRNVALLREYQQLSPEGFASLCAAQRHGMGEPGRFAGPRT